MPDPLDLLPDEIEVVSKHEALRTICERLAPAAGTVELDDLFVTIPIGDVAEIVAEYDHLIAQLEQATGAA